MLGVCNLGKFVNQAPNFFSQKYHVCQVGRHQVGLEAVHPLPAQDEFLQQEVPRGLRRPPHLHQAGQRVHQGARPHPQRARRARGQLRQGPREALGQALQVGQGHERHRQQLLAFYRRGHGGHGRDPQDHFQPPGGGPREAAQTLCRLPTQDEEDPRIRRRQEVEDHERVARHPSQDQDQELFQLQRERARPRPSPGLQTGPRPRPLRQGAHEARVQAEEERGGRKEDGP